MGLDMYLNATRYLRYTETELKKQIAALVPDAPGEPKQVEVEAIYWRKANEIHAWFVKHVQDGKDDCGDYYVSREQMQELCDTVKQGLDNPELAPSLLPTQAGFFFGGTEYDQDYIADLTHTHTKLLALLAREKDEWNYEYHSSW